MRVERQPPKVKTRGGESGAILVEAIIGLVIFTVVLLSAAQFLRWNVEPLLMRERQDKAAKQAESVLNELAARRNADLPAGGSFAITAQGDPVRNADNTVTLNCTTSYCDQIVATPQAAGTAFDFGRAARQRDADLRPGVAGRDRRRGAQLPPHHRRRLPRRVGRAAGGTQVGSC